MVIWTYIIHRFDCFRLSPLATAQASYCRLLCIIYSVIGLVDQHWTVQWARLASGCSNATSCYDRKVIWLPCTTFATLITVVKLITRCLLRQTLRFTQLDAVDVVASYWMGPAIAHISWVSAFPMAIISLFPSNTQGKRWKLFLYQGLLPTIWTHLRGSRWARRHKTAHQLSSWSTGGCLYLPALWRDRGWPAIVPEYMREINALKDKPRFYNTLTTNCTTIIWLNARVNPVACAIQLENSSKRLCTWTLIWKRFDWMLATVLFRITTEGSY